MTVLNPLSGLVEVLAPPEGGPTLRPAWMKVHALDPLRLRAPGAAEPVAVTPVSLVPSEELAVGAKVLAAYMGTTLVVLGATTWPPPSPPPWTVATLENGWTHYTPFGSLRYRLEGDVVRLAGVVRNGTPGSATPIATLPPECRPSGTRIMGGLYGSTAVDVRVSPAGALYVSSSSVSLGWLSLESVSFSL